MTRTILDQDMLTWEVYPSGGPHGVNNKPYIMFNCLSNRMLRPRYVSLTGDEADAERRVVLASNEELLAMFRQAQEIA